MTIRRALPLVLTAVVAAVPFLWGPAAQSQTHPSALTGADPPEGAIWLDSLDLSRIVQRRGTPRAGRSSAGRGNNPPPLQAAPLLIGADMAQFDSFTTALMTNHEALEVSQDVLGRGASRLYQRERLELWARPLADGTLAAGFFNRGLQRVTMTATWNELGLAGAHAVRDVWLHRDLGTLTGEFSAAVPAHGAVMVKIGRPRPR